MAVRQKACPGYSEGREMYSVKSKNSEKQNNRRSIESLFSRLLWYALPYLFCVDNCFAVPAEHVEEGKVEEAAQNKPLNSDGSKRRM